MKKLLSAMMLFSNSIFAQEENMQIGFLKFNHSHPDSVSQQALINHIESRHPLKIRQLKLVEIFEPKSNDNYYDKLKSTFIPGYRHFKASVLYVNDLALNDVSLLFFNDTLIKMNCEIDFELEKILTYKYGKPKETNKLGKVTCRYNFTGTLNTYPTNKNIKVWIYKGSEAVAWSCSDYVNCEKFFTSGFSFEVAEKMKVYEGLCASNLKKIQKEREKETITKMNKY
jgi:hypothetical protein